MDFGNRLGAVPVPLTRGFVAIVDEADADSVLRFKWCAVGPPSRVYAGRNVYLGGGRHGQKQKTVYMHRLLLVAPTGAEVDHINNDSLDNRRENLRLCSHKENGRNNPHVKARSGFKGVIRRSASWHARITVDGKDVHLGAFETAEAAARARDAAALERFGEFAVLNFPEGE